LSVTRLSQIAGGILLSAGVAMAAGAMAGDASVDLRKAEQLSPSETVKQAREYKQKMTDTSGRIDRLLDKAKKQKDVIKINCLQDKSTKVKGHIAVADQSMTTMNTAVSRSDDGARQHEFLRLTILVQKVIVLGTEAENCIGEDVSYVGETKVQVEVDPSIPDDVPTEPAANPPMDVSRPPQATPFV
jgi:hypothetical protein